MLSANVRALKYLLSFWQLQPNVSSSVDLHKFILPCFLLNLLHVVSCVSEIHQTGFRASASRHSCLGRLEARLSQLRPSAQLSRLCTILQDFQYSHLGCPCILSSASGRHLTRFLHGMLYDRSLANLPVLGEIEY